MTQGAEGNLYTLVSRTLDEVLGMRQDMARVQGQVIRLEADVAVLKHDKDRRERVEDDSGVHKGILVQQSRVTLKQGLLFAAIALFGTLFAAGCGTVGTLIAMKGHL